MASGNSSKSYFDSTFSKPVAILTDTINNYPKSTYSSFTIKTSAGAQQGLGFVGMGFNHKYDTDTLKDGGTILISIDDQNWQTLTNSGLLYLEQNNGN